MEFKPVILHNDKAITHDSRKFELLVEDYLNTHFPLEDWKVTVSTGDNNHDVEARCVLTGKSMWAEAKYTTHQDKNLPSRKFDSTLVSAVLDSSIISLFFFSNAPFASALTCRIREYCHLANVEKIAFVDGPVLSHWINSSPEMQSKYFQRWKPRQQEKCLRLQQIWLYHRLDSYTLDAVVDGTKLPPLLSWGNYILEAEILARGYENTPVQISCNDVLLHEGILGSGLHAFSLNKVLQRSISQGTRSLVVQLNFEDSGSAKRLGELELFFSEPEHFFHEQQRIYGNLWQSLQASQPAILWIHGPEGVGKSWLINKLRDDLLRQEQKKDRRVIYLSFSGNVHDTSLLCRLLFTLVFDYYSLSFSEELLKKYVQQLDIHNTIFSPEMLDEVIFALKKGDYLQLRQMLAGMMASTNGQLPFFSQSFAHARIYLLNDVHLLESLDRQILMGILSAVTGRLNLHFVVTDRHPSLDYSHKYHLEALSDDELLAFFQKNKTEASVENIRQILPAEHGMGYPALALGFLRDIEEQKADVIAAQQYYTQVYQEKAGLWGKGLTSCTKKQAPLLVLFMLAKELPAECFCAKDAEEWITEGYLKKNGRILLGVPAKIQTNVLSRFAENHAAILRPLFKQLLAQKLCTYEEYLLAQYTYYPKDCPDAPAELLAMAKVHFAANRYMDVVRLLKPLAQLDTSHNDLQNRECVYYYAFSLMHYGKSAAALQMFRELEDVYETLHLPQDGIYYDAVSEIIDAQYWLWAEYSILPARIHRMRKLWMLHNPRQDNKICRAYLTATNRMMVYLLCLDDLHNAGIWLKKNLRLAGETESEEHIGYTLMDYAKGLYCYDLEKALMYLQTAQKIFGRYTTENRRYHDCTCEIHFVRLLLGRNAYPDFIQARNQLFISKYWAQYYKSSLKLCLYYLLQGDKGQAREMLAEARNAIALKGNPRVGYFIDMFDKAFGAQGHMESCPPAGTAYHRLNQQEPASGTLQLYHAGYSGTAGYFYLDPRVW